VVVVYLKNGEKAPLPDATAVRLDATSDAKGLMLRCLFGDQEVGQFKWDEVAGYSIAATAPLNENGGSYDAWHQRMERGV
jgi:hypothetical protein